MSCASKAGQRFGGSCNLKYFAKLIGIEVAVRNIRTLARALSLPPEDRHTTKHLHRDAANSPLINFGIESLAAQEQLRRPVPQRGQLSRHRPLRSRCSLLRHAEVADLELIVAADEQVLRLQVRVGYLCKKKRKHERGV